LFTACRFASWRDLGHLVHTNPLGIRSLHSCSITKHKTTMRLAKQSVLAGNPLCRALRQPLSINSTRTWQCILPHFARCTPGWATHTGRQSSVELTERQARYGQHQDVNRSLFWMPRQEDPPRPCKNSWQIFACVCLRMCALRTKARRQNVRVEVVSRYMGTEV
jgi:hypothetical protein